MWEVWRSTAKSFSIGSKDKGPSSPSRHPDTPTSLARIASTTVQFKDISIGPEFHDYAGNADEADDEDLLSEDRQEASCVWGKGFMATR